MGPNDKSRDVRSNPLHVEFNESDEEEIARLRAEGWQIGFGVEMRAVGIVQDDEEGENAGEDQAQADDQTATSSDDESNRIEEEDCVGTVSIDGYKPLALDETLPATSTAVQWLPTSNANLLPPPPPAELGQIGHQPVDFNMDQAKVNEIKGIMAQMNISAQPEWARQIDDRKLTELVELLRQRQGDSTKTTKMES